MPDGSAVDRFAAHAFIDKAKTAIVVDEPVFAGQDQSAPALTAYIVNRHLDETSGIAFLAM